MDRTQEPHPSFYTTSYISPECEEEFLVRLDGLFETTLDEDQSEDQREQRPSVVEPNSEEILLNDWIKMY